MIDKKQIEEALKNIAELKSAVNNNLEGLRPSFISKQFIHSILICSILFTVATGITAVTIYKFGSATLATPIYRGLIIFFAALAFAYIVAMKFKALKSNESESFKSLMKHKAFSKLYINILYTLIIAFLSFLAIQYRFEGMLSTSWTLLPILVIAYGVCVIMSGSALAIKEMSASGYAITILGLITFFCFEGSILLWSMIDVTLILYALYFSLSISLKRSR
jgi:hypothetical protein